MAKIKSERLIKKYGTDNIHAGKYQDLMTEVLANNNEAISRAILRQSKSNWIDGLKSITTKEKQFILPDISDVLPKRSVFVSKSAQSGKFIIDTLKDRLTNDLRTSIQDYLKKPYVRRFGIFKRDRINPDIIKDFQNKIKGTFEGYTKKDPRYGVPGNIRNIAVTEVRSAVDTIKYSYGQTLLQKNKDLEAFKIWIHNDRLSKVNRRGHKEADRQRVGWDEDFIINAYKKVKGKLYFVGKIRTPHPHHQSMPLDEKIGCSCDYEIMIRRK